MAGLRSGDLALDDACREEGAYNILPLRFALPKLAPPLPTTGRAQPSSPTVIIPEPKPVQSTPDAVHPKPLISEVHPPPAFQVEFAETPKSPPDVSERPPPPLDHSPPKSPVDEESQPRTARPTADDTSGSLDRRVIIKPLPPKVPSRTDRRESPREWIQLALGGLIVVLLLLVVVNLVFLGTESQKGPTVGTTPAPPPPVVSQNPRVESTPVIQSTPVPVNPTTTHPEFAAKENPFVNSLGMRFAPIPETSVLLSIWDARVMDYQAFADETHRAVANTSFPQDRMHPVVNVSWDEATAFCDWLTVRERQRGLLFANQHYRLPTNMEWDCAVGLNCQMDLHKYPWGDDWPPPRNSGNYGQQLGVDPYEYTSPVGSFAPNRHGFYDIGGNVMTWCEDWSDETKVARVQRGSSWGSASPPTTELAARFSRVPGERSSVVGFRCVLTLLTRNGRTWQTWMGEFVKNFVADNQLSDVDANLAYYGTLVNYFGNGEKDQSYIRSDIEKYNERWPTRHDSIDGSIEFQEKTADKEYAANFKLNYYAESQPRGLWSKGQFEITLDIMAFGGVPKIVGIKEKVLRQEHGNLNPVAKNSPWPSATVSAADSTGANQSEATPPVGNAGRSVTPQPKKTDNPILYKLQPKYPASVKRLRIEGSGTFRLRFDGSGAVRSVQTLKSTGNQLLDAAAIDALKHWLVVPGTETLSVPVTFSLPRSAPSPGPRNYAPRNFHYSPPHQNFH